MWSFGCILYELFTGFPLFQGENEQEQIDLMVHTLGFPSQQFLLKVKKKDKYFNKEKQTKNKDKTLAKLMKNAPENLICLIKVH